MNDLISKAKALKAIEAAARLCVADANHNYLMGFQDAAEAVGQVELEHLREATRKKGDDYISRQAAIDALSLGKEILSRVLDDTDVVGTDREKYSWGLELIEANIKDIEELPSAQPDHFREVAKKVDLISRQDAIEDAREAFKRNPTMAIRVMDLIKSMPSAQPERKTGWWRHYEGYLTCSECGTEYDDDIMTHCGDDVPKFCPECGADMRCIHERR